MNSEFSSSIMSESSGSVAFNSAHGSSDDVHRIDVDVDVHSNPDPLPIEVRGGEKRKIKVQEAIVLTMI